MAVASSSGAFSPKADLLGVVSGQAGEDDHAEGADHEGHGRALEENIDDHGDDQPEQAHHHEAAHAGEITFGDGAVDAHSAEHGRAGDERGHDGSARIHKQYRGQERAHQCAVDDEESGGGKRGQPGDHAAQDQRHGEHGDGEDDQAEGVAEDGGQKSRGGRDEKGGPRRDKQADRHPLVHMAHEDGCDADTG